MTRDDILLLCGVLILLSIGAAYGYGIGHMAVRRSWSGRKVRSLALGPFLTLTIIGGIAQIAALVMAHDQAMPPPAWIHAGRLTRLPNFVTLGAGLLALFVAARVARPELPFREVLNNKLSAR